MKKVKVKNGKKYIIRRMMLIFFLLIVILAIFIPLLMNLNSTESKYSSTKNSQELKLSYEVDGKKEEFLVEASEIQNAVSMEILNSNVVDNASLKTKIKEINKELTKDTWTTFNMDKPAFWVGTWKVESDGSVKFQFINKKVEPNWVTDEDAVSYVKLNK